MMTEVIKMRDTTYALEEFYHIFERTDRRARHLGFTGGFRLEDNSRTYFALRRFAERKLRRFAGTNGIAYTQCKIETQRRPDLRMAEIILWFDYAVIPEAPGEYFIFHDPPPAGWQPL